MLETMNEDYIRTARAKGLPERTVVVKHGLRAALTPIVTIFGMDLGLLLGGAIITEVTFSLKGLGLFTVQAIQNQDLPEILGVTMLAAFFIVILKTIAVSPGLYTRGWMVRASSSCDHLTISPPPSNSILSTG